MKELCVVLVDEEKRSDAWVAVDMLASLLLDWVVVLTVSSELL